MTGRIIGPDRRGPALRRRRRHAVAGLCLVGLGAGSAVLAQGQQGGQLSPPRLTFGADLGITASDNPNFVVNPPEGGIWASGGLSFGFFDDTPLSTFSLRGNVGLRAGIAGDTQGGAQVTGTTLRLNYDRQGADSTFNFGARLDDKRIQFLRPLSDFIDDNGVFVPPDDIDDLSGTGTRRRLSFDTSLTLFQNAPFGMTLGAGASRTDYFNVTNPALDDSRRHYADLGLRFNLTEVATATAGVRFSHFEDSNQSDDAVNYRAGLSITRPNGALNFSLGSTQTANGTAYSAQVGRSMQMPWGDFDVNIGATKTASANTSASGSLRVNYTAFPQGNIVAALTRSVVSGDNNAETLRTSASVGFSNQINQNSSWSIDLAYLMSENVAASVTTQDISLGLGYSRALTQDWNLNFGYRFRQRDKDLVGTSSENVVTVSISRNFDIGF